jgi:TPR repeat protein
MNVQAIPNPAAVGIVMSRAFFGFCVTLIACIPWIADSAAFAHALGSAYDLGRILPHNPSAAICWYRKAALQGDAPAAYQVGSMYYAGEGVPPDQHAAALWWHSAAQLGYAPAEAAMGDAYCMGIGVFPNCNEARRWWLLAEAQRNSHATQMAHSKFCTGHSSIVKAHASPEI